MSMMVNSFRFAIGGFNWIAATLPALNLDTDAWNNYTLRQAINGSLPANGNFVQFSLRAGSTQPLTITSCYVQKGGGGFSFSSTPLQVFFNGGSPSATIAAGAGLMCDPVAMALLTTDALVIAIYTNGGTASDMYLRNNGGPVNFVSAYKLGNDAATVAASGYTVAGGNHLYLDDLEISA